MRRMSSITPTALVQEFFRRGVASCVIDAKQVNRARLQAQAILMLGDRVHQLHHIDLARFCAKRITKSLPFTRDHDRYRAGNNALLSWAMSIKFITGRPGIAEAVDQLFDECPRAPRAVVMAAIFLYISTRNSVVGNVFVRQISVHAGFPRAFRYRPGKRRRAARARFPRSSSHTDRSRRRP